MNGEWLVVGFLIGVGGSMAVQVAEDFGIRTSTYGSR